jgi:hypothetical protein
MAEHHERREREMRKGKWGTGAEVEKRRDDEPEARIEHA